MKILKCNLIRTNGTTQQCFMDEITKRPSWHIKIDIRCGLLSKGFIKECGLIKYLIKATDILE